MSSTLQVKKIKCRYQNYAWGKKGASSKVFDLLKPLHCENPDQNLPFAELWLGTHPNAPSFLTNSDGSGNCLREEISSNPEQYLGTKVFEKFGNDLPFLLKVLSVGTALSIQAHPDKELGARLHQERPDLYKDPNHKPEMTIALTKFEALNGFRPLNEIATFLKVAELRALIGEETASNFESKIKSQSNNGEDSPLKEVFKALMTSPEEKVKEQLSSLVKRIETTQPFDPVLNELIIRINSQYPGDVGVFCIFFLNYCILHPGQAAFLCANEPHAYLSGDCVECMATSDNVVRAGLTPKFKDVNVLVNMLTYKAESNEKQKMNGTKIEGHLYTVLYDPPIPEFSVASITLPNSGLTETVTPVDGPGILLVTNASEGAKLIVDGTLLTQVVIAQH
ncbi:phosphomannose isomerase type I [Neoconidiobolus thromboides FSU 785]|nr:phosphomannose isomerase type I [Neoconidiobolus thromboides FSU 785]